MGYDAILYGILAGVVLLVGGGIYAQASSSRREERVQRLRSRKRQLQLELRDLQDSVAHYKQMELDLLRRVGDAEAKMEASAKNGKPAAPVARPTNLTDLLLAEKLISEEQYARAVSYCRGSGANCDPLDAAVMLGFIGADVLARYRANNPKLL